MKALILGQTMLLCCIAVLAKAQEVSAAETLTTFHWTPEEVAVLVTDKSTSVSRFIPSFPLQLPLEYTGTAPKQYTLRTLGPGVISLITAKHYAIIGNLRCSNVTSGSYLEMWSYFAPQQPGGSEGAYFTRTLGDGGPMAKLEGSDDGREFALPFDATDAKTKLVRLVMNLHLAGPGSVVFSNVKLVQYPDAPAAPANSEVALPDKTKDELSQDVNAQKEILKLRLELEKSRADSQLIAKVTFLLGVATTIFAIALTSACVFLKRRLKRRANERELRRIASLDG
jgi:hypothetical protein